MYYTLGLPPEANAIFKWFYRRATSQGTMSFVLKWGMKYISQKVFRENKWNKFGVEDPYYDVYEVEQQSLFGGAKTKKVRKPKAMPEGLSLNDEAVLRKVMRRAYHLEMLFSIWGYKIGWAGILGLIPIVGDIASVCLSLMLLWTARAVDGGLPWIIQLQFLANIAIDFAIGLVPIVGDLVEVMYKANSRNAVVLEKYLKKKGELNLQRQAGLIPEDTDVAMEATGFAKVDSALEDLIAKSPLKRGTEKGADSEQYTVGKDPDRIVNGVFPKTSLGH